VKRGPFREYPGEGSGRDGWTGGDKSGGVEKGLQKSSVIRRNCFETNDKKQRRKKKRGEKGGTE